MRARVCPYCGKEFIPKNSKQVCCSKSCAMKNRWKNPEYKEKQIKNIKEAFKRPGFKEKWKKAVSKGWTEEKRKKQSDIQKQKWKDPKFHEERSEINKKLTQSEESRKIHSEITKQQWKDEEFRNKNIESRKRVYANRTSKQRADINKRVREAKALRGTVITSGDELTIKNFLETKFGKVLWQYMNKKYPFLCDFYIPSLDLYIEYQGFWTHGYKPYEGTEEDLAKVNLWKKRSVDKKLKDSTRNMYQGAIEVWTKKDVLKRKTAKENGLNWIEFFTMPEFYNWFFKQGKSING